MIFAIVALGVYLLVGLVNYLVFVTPKIKRFEWGGFAAVVCLWGRTALQYMRVLPSVERRSDQQAREIVTRGKGPYQSEGRAWHFGNQ
jgi:hypothetical protein